MLGQPLDLAVDVRLDSADDAGSACFEADVFHGDGQVAPNRVRVIVVGGAQAGQDAVVRIRSSAVVDEPVVGVVLRSVCSQKASRRYDFLTDFPVETHAASVPTIIPATVTAQTAAPSPLAAAPVAAPAPAPVAVPRPAPIRRATNPAPVVRAPRPAPVSKPIVAKEPKEPVAVPKPVSTKAEPKLEAKAEAPDNKPRLKLESPETPDERLVQLKPASDLVLSPTDDPQKREAAAAAWRELNNLPLENPQEKQRLLTLEAESKTLKALLAKNEADFKLRLDRLESNRYDESFVYSLLGLLLAAIAAAAFFWNRARQRLVTATTDWSHHGEPSAEELRAAPMSRPASLASQLPPNTLPGPNHDADVDESLFDDLKKLTAATIASKPLPPAARSGVTAMPARSVYPDDFLDVQQHADFFVSLGQYDQAIDVLKKSIHESADVSPLAYLELLKIYHTLGRQAEFQQQRDAFNRIFNSQIPEFSAFAQEGQPLESYPAVLRNIESQWGTPKVLDTIEASLFRDTATGAGKPFDLAAYRELLLLYAMAQGTVRQADGSLHSAMPKARPGRASRPQELELDVSKPVPLDDSVPRETSFTQPMLLMSEMAPLEAQDTHPEPLAPSHRAPLDLDLDLNLDFSNSELMAMQELPVVPGAIPPAPAALDLDFDLDLGVPGPVAAPVPVPPAVPTIDSNMLEFDLFDPKVEAKISPKKS
ncbi:hypothetical protein [Rhodoferax sp.]|uniref:hypothetical protein n=1 Tax=Rhodoferax sp. TaxID=50421 RepID=UPI0032676233